MGERFENQNLAGAVFRNVNLHQAVFDDVNLAGASIRNASLKDLAIVDAHIEGLTIFGIRVDHLIAAEFDRRDPERVRLRMGDIFDPNSVRIATGRLEVVRAGLRELLRATPTARLTSRPEAGQWSPIEIVRHLLYSEDAWINHWILQNDVPLSKLGLLPDFMAEDPKYAGVGDTPSDDLETVLAAWDEIHAQTRAFLDTLTPEMLRREGSRGKSVGQELQNLVQHELHHIREIEALLARLEGAAGSAESP